LGLSPPARIPRPAATINATVPGIGAPSCRFLCVARLLYHSALQRNTFGLSFIAI
jgi:hypothetical protein